MKAHKWDLARYVRKKYEDIVELFSGLDPESAVNQEGGNLEDQQEMLKALAKVAGVDLLPEHEEEIHWCDDSWWMSFMTVVVIFALLFLGLSLDNSPRDVPLLHPDRIWWYIGELVINVIFWLDIGARLQHKGWEYFDDNKNDFFVGIGLTFDNLFCLYYRDDTAVLAWSRWFDLLYIFKSRKLEYIGVWLQAYPMAYEGLGRFWVYYNKIVIAGLFWTLVFACIISHMFATLIRSRIGNQSELYMPYMKISGWDWRESFGTMLKCFLTLLRIIQFDQGIIEDSLRPVMEVQPFEAWIFFMFYSLVTIALLNVLTSMIVAVAVSHTDENTEFMWDMEHKTRQVQLTKLGKLFQVLDTDGGGTLSRLELEAWLDEDQIMNVFKECEIPFEEAFELFDLIDRDQTGELDIDEFLGACSRIRGDCKSKDVHTVKLATECINIKMDYLNESIVECYMSILQLDNIVGRIERVQRRADQSIVVVKPGKENLVFRDMEFGVPGYMEYPPKLRAKSEAID